MCKKSENAGKTSCLSDNIGTSIRHVSVNNYKQHK